MFLEIAHEIHHRFVISEAEFFQIFFIFLDVGKAVVDFLFLGYQNIVATHIGLHQVVDREEKFGYILVDRSKRKCHLIEIFLENVYFVFAKQHL